MIIKKYKANSMNEAITRIKYELGSEAVIISQRKIRKKGILGFFSKKILEVTAAVDNKKREDNVNYGIRTIKKIVNAGMKDDLSSGEKSAGTGNFYENNITRKNNEELIKEVQQMKGMLNKMMNSPYGNIGKSELQLKLESSDLNDKVIKKILSSINIMEDDRKDEEKLKEVVQNMIKVDKKKLAHVAVLVGPTGVGKTTTIAKLAGRLALMEKKKIGLITIDTYRIGAVEQLRTYADIMNIPFKVVFTIKDMEKATEDMKNCDTILIDTTGRNSKNKMQISELRAFIDKVKTDNIHLVISCTTKDRDVDAIVNGYKQLNYNNIIITKLDETCTYGSILNILQSAKKPISFVTTGQNVPEDIKTMSSEELTKLVLGEDIVC
ncbi:flagellar biosynthesis protein FlhF [Clostridium luticellarii]|jgi:flagellar biosynthesis protein FlhF|uniref:Flagellar biosynthesis protein FlhF n=1 Tax=Clostridium luticellarii TaxID=1691940 RepID=A0A2T0BRV1_9CLOT|nr:flagellar biosynthesis protein FlhF [Clostridium luticellarii]MCI1943687.1 flagellar biosynthesis protein FlhF [Clostridium luticellarii]MCI1968938.1 flagellar biosynthesis protein FlhF [Clostridium luticellarii]MCI1994315.1 flagellar biosynthesis protein FlhF [Clostridium luticellarii]MCI2038732.1 flagellar biosynthesis protein FlhF [Clostridium luticellarii]PRR86607.1 Flagellar biosynthesis protein FlhF [Clostridium luticellarii]